MGAKRGKPGLNTRAKKRLGFPVQCTHLENGLKVCHPGACGSGNSGGLGYKLDRIVGAWVGFFCLPH